MKYTCEQFGFRPIRHGRTINGAVIDSLGAAAKAFAQRRANGYGKNRQAMIKPDYPDRVFENGAVYGLIIVAPSGASEYIGYLEVKEESDDTNEQHDPLRLQALFADRPWINGSQSANQ